MNFCYNSFGQKQIEQSVSCKHHVAHHCIHSHSCSRIDHKRNKSNENKETKKGIIEYDQAFKKSNENICQFKGEFNNNKQIRQQQKVKKILQKRQMEIKQLKKKINDLQNKLGNESQQKSDLNSQLHYYRQKFTTLIQCSNMDTKNEINKRLSETTDLNFKIKSIEAKNRDLIQKNKELRQQREELERKFQRLKSNYEKIVDHNHNLSLKVRDSQVDKRSKSKDWQKKWKQLKKNEDNYKILIVELKRNCQNQQQNTKTLSIELQNLKVNKKNKQKKYHNELEINNIKLNQLIKEQECLKNENQNKLKDKEQLEKNLKQMIEKNNDLEEQIKHIRKLIQINGTVNRVSQIQIKYRNVLNQKNKEVKEKQNKEKIQKLGISEEEEILKRQVVVLKEQIQKLKFENSRNIQEIILNIGPSEAFKRILDEKNIIIKQLMREKAQFKSTAILASNCSQ